MSLEKKQKVYILSIETSCDETALSFVTASGGLEKPKFEVHGDVVASPLKLHQPYGGVVPGLAKRAHLENLPLLFKEIVDKIVVDSRLRGNDKEKGGNDNAGEADFMNRVDFITVTVGPGLEPALWTGIEFAKELAVKYGKPLVPTNHLEGHLYSFLVSKDVDSRLRGNDNAGIFPAIALIISGGHTILLRMDDLTHFKKLGETVDDAAADVLIKKTLRAVEEFGAKSIMISGGVSANRTLRALFTEAIEKKFTLKKDRPLLIVSEF